MTHNSSDDSTGPRVTDQGGGRAGGAAGAVPPAPAAAVRTSAIPASNNAVRPYRIRAASSGRAVEHQHAGGALLITLAWSREQREDARNYCKSRMMIEAARRRLRLHRACQTAPPGEAADLMNLIRREAQGPRNDRAVSRGATQVLLDTSSGWINHAGGIVETLLGVSGIRRKTTAKCDDTGYTGYSSDAQRISHPSGRCVDLRQTNDASDRRHHVPGTIVGSGRAIIIGRTRDNTLMTFRFHNWHQDVASREPFIWRHHFHRAFGVIPAPIGSGPHVHRSPDYPRGRPHVPSAVPK